MSNVNLRNYADEGRLVDADIAGFLRKKLDKGDKLDFTDIVEVADAVLDALFEGWLPEQAANAIAQLSPAADKSLAAWTDRAGGKVTKVEKTTRKATVRRPASLTRPASILERDPSGDERFTPTRLVRRLQEALRGYIESAYPLNDPTLVRARRRLLEEDAGGHLLAQEPYIETTTRYATSKATYGDLGFTREIAAFFSKLAKTPSAQSTPEDARTVLFPSMYVHQERAFHEFLVEGKDIVVATGTGSGKTECFLVPMLGSLYDEAVRSPKTFDQPAVRALILYPMNALVNDQLSRLRLLLGDPAVADAFKELGKDRRFPRFGMYTGRTPYPGPRTTSRDADRVKPLLDYYLGLSPDVEERLRRLGRYPAKDLQNFYAQNEARRRTYQSGKRAGQEYTDHNWERRLHTGPGDRELLTRQEMVHGAGSRPGHAPDVLVTNYSMLEYMLMRPFERPIFAETKRWLEQEGTQLLLVLDEAHMYRGAKGAEVAFLIRRLRARLGIHDRPDKLRVIATSASLGDGAAAVDAVKRFAADITGKRPEDFEAITGTREVPTPASPAPKAVSDTLASLDLDGINEALDAPALREKLAPLLPKGGNPNPDENEVLAELYAALKDQPWVNQLVKEAAGQAVALGDLAPRVFPGHPDARRALEALLTVSTLARNKADEPGLVPTRVHGLFRGLHGLYACVNPHCDGRQSEPGEKAILGKLFTTPRAVCDACGCRVFEIASCRSCGSPYLLAYSQEDSLDRLSFLWGETEGALFRLELLPSAARYTDRTEIVRLHLRTGYLDTGNRFPDDEVRELEMWLDADGKREASFDRCAMCQPAAPAKSRIYDFRTRGEQPFTALIEAQFAEQPPQKRDPRLPNHGRKVLVFSDGRQKAARLAPALEHSHARDLFRQVVALAAHELREKGGLSAMQYLYPAVVHLCAHRGYDLFPATDELEFHNHLGQVKGKTLEQTITMANKGWLRATRSFAQAIFSELTDRYYSLPALALATVEEDPDTAFMIFDDFPNVGLDADAQKVLFRAWLRQHLERRSFRPDGAETRELGEGWAHPQGINAARLEHVLPNRFDQYLAHVLGGDTDKVEKVGKWFQHVVRDKGLLHFESDVYYLQLQGLSMNLRLDANWLRCRDCARIHPEALADVCPACLGAVVEVDADYLDARTGFYRQQVQRAFDERAIEPFGLLAAEHSAQLTGQPDESAFNKVEEYELRFQDVPLDNLPPIDVLSCTTTMEVGIDIGALSGVALRNVPPHVANYQQRAGRAGRRGRSIASVITYAHGTSHDAHFFDHPEQIISGDVRAPVVYVENQQVLERHIHAYLVQRFFHERVPPDPTSYDLFGSLGSVEQFLSESHPCSLLKLEGWLDENADLLRSELRGWVPAFSFGLNEPVAEVNETIQGAIDRSKARIREVLPVEEYAARDTLVDLERESLERRLEEPLLETLIGHAVFPRYAFPTDVVTFWVSKPRQPGDAPGKRTFDYEPQRDLQLALTEYAPGRSLTIDKWRFESAALYSPYEPTPVHTIQRQRPYMSCSDCSWATMDSAMAQATLCPVCGSDQLTRTAFITPAGFAPDLNAKREVDRGQAISYAGMTDRARLEPQDPPSAWTEGCDGRLLRWTGPRRLVMVNKGVGQRGFRVCPDCGRSEPEYGPGFTATKLMRNGAATTHQHPLEKGVVCAGVADGPFYLGHEFPTDALLLRLRVMAPVQLGGASTTGLLTRASRMALSSLVEALGLAASRVLQIDEGELSGWWTPVMGGRRDEAQLYLYDLLPGGAGYARAVGNDLPEVLDAAEALLGGCDCPSSCYRCIRHYGNNWIHASLDRHLALALLRHLRTGELPSLTDPDKDRALVALCQLLTLRGIACEENVQVGGTRVPLVIQLPKSRVCVDVHHPLIDPLAHESPIIASARSQFLEAVSLDAFDLLHDLPAAVARLKLPGGAGG
ncbi:DEAD/DEAH box helicase [Ramlibacter sp. USB13]|uniref:DEAD/DEAH box helicase n=1 Tax=Ramlibacter cellulosilyticus TaxID=2764187 RepID=A0A923MVU2_9BURK|nr:DEAD/DEAH box helicase [Ramlibacter cellulosilyticus]